MTKEKYKIMYDQEAETHQYIWELDSVFNEVVATNMEKLSGYVPENWVLYNCNINKYTTFFGAYPESTLQKEAEIGLACIKNKSYIENFDKAFVGMLPKAQELSKTYFSNFYNKEKESIINNKEIVSKFLKDCSEFIGHIYSYHLLIQPQRFYEIEKDFKGEKNKEIDTLYQISPELTTISILQKTILEEVQKIYKTGLSPQEYYAEKTKEKNNLFKVIDSYGFFSWDILGGELYSRENIIEKLEKLLADPKNSFADLKQIHNTEKEIKERNKIEVTDNKYEIADIVGRLLLYRYEYNTYVFCIANYMNILIHALSDINEVSWDDTGTYYMNDIINFLENGVKVSDEEVANRKKGYLMIYNKKNGYRKMSGDKANNEIKDILKERADKYKTTKETKGQVASNPDTNNEIITGKAFVLKSNININEQAKQLEGEPILVATQTHPAVVPIMKKSKAIVTDEGGVTCHAAIVSRELGLPCIIGTKLATKIFKTGDDIELNMMTGAVKKK